MNRRIALAILFLALIGWIAASWWKQSRPTMEQGVALLRENDPRGAKEVFTRVLSEDPKSGEAYRWRGRCLLAIGDTPGALVDYARSLELQPDNLVLARERSLILESEALFLDARHAWKEILDRTPDDPDAWHGLGRALEGALKYSDADQAYGEAIRRERSRAVFHLARGSLRATMGRRQEAEFDLGEAIRLDSGSQEAHYRRGRLFVSLRLPSRAVADFDTMILLAPEDPRGYLERAIARLSSHSYKQPFEDFDSAIRFGSADPRVRIERARVHAARGKFDFALQDLDEALRMDPREPEALRLRALLLRWSGDLARARESIERAREIAPKSPSILCEMAWLETADGKLDRAVSAWSAYREVALDDPFGRLLLGATTVLKGDLHRGRSELEEGILMLERNPMLPRSPVDRPGTPWIPSDSNQVKWRLCRANYYAGISSGFESREGVASFRRAIALDPSFEPAWRGLIKTHMGVRDYAAALGEISRYLDRFSPCAEILLIRREINYRFGKRPGVNQPRLREALESDLSEAETLEPNHPDVAFARINSPRGEEPWRFQNPRERQGHYDSTTLAVFEDRNLPRGLLF